MKYLTPAVSAALDGLGSINGKPNTKTIKGPVILWHCGTLSITNKFRPNEGVWTFRNEDKKERYAGQATSRYLSSLSPEAKKLGIKPYGVPYLLRFELASKVYKAIDFQGGSLSGIMSSHYRDQHHETKMAMCEWAITRGYDIVIGTNFQPEEFFVVNPGKHLKIISQKNLLDGSEQEITQNLIARILNFLRYR